MKRETFEWERNMQPFMDDFYRRNLGEPDRSKSCRQFDVIVNGKRYEEKFLFSHPYKKMLVEIVQDIVTADLGWFYHVRADYLMWVHCPPDRKSPPIDVRPIKWSELKREVIETLMSNKWQQFQVCSDHYGTTLNLPIEWEVLIRKGIARIESYVKSLSTNMTAP